MIDEIRLKLRAVQLTEPSFRLSVELRRVSREESGCPLSNFLHKLLVCKIDDLVKIALAAVVMPDIAFFSRSL